MRQNDLCECGHERKHHGKSQSINYTDGKCTKCLCEHFIMDNSSCFTRAKGIMRNWLNIRPKDEENMARALMEIDTLYYNHQKQEAKERHKEAVKWFSTVTLTGDNWDRIIQIAIEIASGYKEEDKKCQ